MDSHPAFGRFRTVLLAGGLLTLIGCGSGGPSWPDPEPTVPPGIQGSVHLADLDLGRLVEQEPNDGRAQSYLLPPLSPRTRLEVTGEVGTSAVWFGHVDPVDAFRLGVLSDQAVAVALTFLPDDPAGGGANDVEVEVFDSDTGALVAGTVDGDQPRTGAFAAARGTVYDVVVTCEAGHAAYVLSFACTDPAGTPPAPAKATALPTPTARTSSSVATHGGRDCAGSHLLVRLRTGADGEAVARRFGLLAGRRTGTGTLRLLFPARILEGRLGAAMAWCARLLADPDVEWAEPDYVVRSLADPDDPDFARQWNLRAVGVQGAWEVTEGDASIVVGVVDSGIVEHPDFEGQVVAGYDFISDGTIAGDGGGRDSDPTDVGAGEHASGLSAWHGTHVAAIVAARSRDGHGLAGVAPGCRVMPLRAIGIGGGLVSDVSDAILYAAGLLTTRDGRRLSEPLPIVNLSLGLDIDTQELRSACSRASNMGVLLVGSAGNTGQRVLYPARYPSVLAVAAVDPFLDTTGYSNYGEEVEIAAPGGLGSRDIAGAGWPDAVLSCVLDDTVYPMRPSLGYLEGTSQAAPHVAGAAALLLSVDPTLSAQTLKILLTGSALDRGIPGRDEAYGWGVLQVHEALRLLLLEGGTPLSTPPRLLLASTSLAFGGFETRHEVCVMNGGGGRLEFSEPRVATDDGAPWLGAEYVLAPGSGSTEVARVVVTVNRAAIGSEPACYSGTVFVPDAEGTVLGTLRIVLFVDQYLLAGARLTAIARTADTGGVRAFGTVSAAAGYRYWFPNLAPGAYKVMGGTDLDGDGFICESGDACGWHGGATEEEATVLEVVRNQTVFDADVVLRQP